MCGHAPGILKKMVMGNFVFFKNVRICNDDFDANRMIDFLKTLDLDMIRNLVYAYPREGSVFFLWFSDSEPYLDQEEIEMPDGDYWWVTGNRFLKEVQRID